MRTCHEIADIVASEPPLSWPARMELRMHLWMCRHCNAYAKQLRMLGNTVRRCFGAKDESRLDQLEEKIVRKHADDKNEP